MDESTKTAKYLSLLDRILAGENDLDSVDDKEIRSLLSLAKFVRSQDLSVRSSLREALRSRLVAHLSRSCDPDELSEDDLDLVAAGYSTSKEKSVCPFCGTSLNDGTCPRCKR